MLHQYLRQDTNLDISQVPARNEHLTLQERLLVLLVFQRRDVVGQRLSDLSK